MEVEDIGVAGGGDAGHAGDGEEGGVAVGRIGEAGVDEVDSVRGDVDGDDPFGPGEDLGVGFKGVDGSAGMDHAGHEAGEDAVGGAGVEDTVAGAKAAAEAVHDWGFEVGAATHAVVDTDVAVEGAGEFEDFIVDADGEGFGAGPLHELVPVHRAAPCGGWLRRLATPV